MTSIIVYIPFAILSIGFFYTLGCDVANLISDSITNTVDPALTFRVNSLTHTQINEIWKRAIPAAGLNNEIYQTFNHNYWRIPQELLPTSNGKIVLPINYCGSEFSTKIDLNHPSVTSYWKVYCTDYPYAHLGDQLDHNSLLQHSGDVQQRAQAILNNWIDNGYRGLWSKDLIKDEGTFNGVVSIYKHLFKNRPNACVGSKFIDYDTGLTLNGKPWLVIESRTDQNNPPTVQVIHSSLIAEWFEDCNQGEVRTAIDQTLEPFFPNITNVPSDSMLQSVAGMQLDSSSHREFLDIYSTLCRTVFWNQERFLCCHVDTSLIPQEQLNPLFKDVLRNYFAHN